MSSFRPPRRSGWRAPWVSGVLAVLIAAALAGAGAAAGAGSTGRRRRDRHQRGCPTDTTTGDTTGDTTTDTTGGDATDDTTTDTTEAADDTATDTAAADDGEDAAADNGNVNNLPLNSGIQTGTVFNPTPYGEVPGNTPQVLIQRPGSGRIVPLNRELTVRVRFANFEPGFFSDPKAEYGVGTQRLNGDGNLQGHNHGCFQRIARNGSVPAETCDSFVVLQRRATPTSSPASCRPDPAGPLPLLRRRGRREPLPGRPGASPSAAGRSTASGCWPWTSASSATRPPPSQ